MMVKIYRQGDVLLREVDEMPKKARKRETDVILEGEVTGHAHRIQHGTIYDLWDQTFVRAGKDAVIVHDEHGPIPIEKGLYEVIRQMEYDPASPRNNWVED